MTFSREQRMHVQSYLHVVQCECVMVRAWFDLLD